MSDFDAVFDKLPADVKTTRNVRGVVTCENKTS